MVRKFGVIQRHEPKGAMASRSQKSREIVSSLEDPEERSLANPF